MSGARLQKSDLPQAIQRAVTFHRQGQLGEAEQLYNGILAAERDHFDALHLLGLLMHQRGRSAEALALIDRALALRPDHFDALFHRGNALLRSGLPADALSSYERALKIQPGHADALVNRGVALQKLQRHAEALESHDRALAHNPGHVQALVNRGNALFDLDRPTDALSSYDRALALRPGDAETLFNRGNALLRLRRAADALASYQQSLALRPGHFESLFNQGNVLHDLGRHAEALASFDLALALRPDHVGLHCNRGNALCDFDRAAEALASFDRALTLAPEQAEALNNRGDALIRLSRPAEALADLDRALSLKPDYAEACNNRGNALKELGRLDEAREAYRQALALDPNLSGIYFNLADLKTFAPGDPHIAAMERLAARPEALSHTDRLHLDFTLGKAHADCKEFPRSFRHLLAGNAAKRATVAYDEASTFAMFDCIEALFTPAMIAAHAGSGDASERPIFVIGFPRSGATLVEQILASHPLVRGAGELKTFSDVVLALRGQGDQGGEPAPYPDCVAALDAPALARLGARYLALVRDLAPDGARVTDKMPSNFSFAGLIHLALPNATIVHTVRDPVDTCVSCFSKLFSSAQNHTYDLRELGRYHRRYRRLMQHWRRVLPRQRMLDVRYEDVVADLEGQARLIVAHCGLPWDDACLSFHRTDRPVHTASAAQVRQPIYRGAVGRWRDYEEFLQPLLAELG